MLLGQDLQGLGRGPPQLAMAAAGGSGASLAAQLRLLPGLPSTTYSTDSAFARARTQGRGRGAGGRHGTPPPPAPGWAGRAAAGPAGAPPGFAAPAGRGPQPGKRRTGGGSLFYGWQGQVLRRRLCWPAAGAATGPGQGPDGICFELGQGQPRRRQRQPRRLRAGAWRCAAWAAAGVWPRPRGCGMGS